MGLLARISAAAVEDDESPFADTEPDALPVEPDGDNSIVTQESSTIGDVPNG